VENLIVACPDLHTDYCLHKWWPDFLLNFFSFFFSSTRAWTPSFVLAWQMLYLLGYVSNNFCSGYFWDRVLLYCPIRLDLDSIYASHSSWVNRHVPLCQFFPLRWVTANFCPGSLKPWSSQSPPPK
jgi:hypothetical protein